MRSGSDPVLPLEMDTVFALLLLFELLRTQ